MPFRSPSYSRGPLRHRVSCASSFTAEALGGKKIAPSISRSKVRNPAGFRRPNDFVSPSSIYAPGVGHSKTPSALDLSGYWLSRLVRCRTPRALSDSSRCRQSGGQSDELHLEYEIITIASSPRTTYGRILTIHRSRW